MKLNLLSLGLSLGLRAQGAIRTLAVAVLLAVGADGASAQCTSEHVASIGGDPQAIYARGTTVYVGYYGRLEILDATNAAAPVTLGQVLLGGTPQRMDVFDSHLYIAMDDAGLAVVDVTNLAAPTVVSTIAGENVEDVAVSDDLAFAIVDSELKVYDVVNPAAPVLRSTYSDIIPNYRAVASRFSTVYLLDFLGEVRVLDATNPASLVLQSTYSLTLSTFAEDVDIRFPILAISTWDGTELIDITNSALPVLRSIVASDGVVDNVSLAEDGATMLLYHEYDNCRIDVHDVTNPFLPVFKASLSHCSNGFWGAQDNVYVCGDKLNFYDVSTPSTPALVYTSDPMPARFEGMVSAGQYLYMIDGYQELKVYDVSNPLAPNQVHGRGLGILPKAIARAGNLLYLGMFDNSSRPSVTGAVWVFDIGTNPAFPIFLASVETESYLLEIAAAGNRVYALDGDGRLIVFDVSNPGAMIELGRLEGVGRGPFALMGSYVLVEDLFLGLKVVDVSVPSAPALVATHAPRSGEFLEGIAVRGTTVFILQSDNKIDVMDMTDPINPVFISGLSTSVNYWSGIGLVDSILCIMVNGHSIRMYETADPANLVQLPIVDVGGYVGTFTLSGSTLWSSAFAAGLQGVSVPQVPRVTEYPQDALVCASSPSVQFSTRVANPADAGGSTFRWRRNGVALSNGPTGNGSAINGATTRTLTINSPVLADVGTYDCQITNTCGTVTTDDASLVAGLKPTILVQPAPVTACYQATATFSVLGIGTGPFEFQWQRESPRGSGNYVSFSDAAFAGYTISGTSTRTMSLIPNLNATLPPALETSYRCLVRNACDSEASDPAGLTVCPADFNCSGSVSVQDVFDFLAAWFAGDTAADFNHVGGISVQDIFDFLAAWFAGC